MNILEYSNIQMLLPSIRKSMTTSLNTALRKCGTRNEHDGIDVKPRCPKPETECDGALNPGWTHNPLHRQGYRINEHI